MKRLILVLAILLLFPLASLSSKGAESLLVATGFGYFLFETVGEAGGFVDSGGADLTHGQVPDDAEVGVAVIGALGFGFGEVGAVELGVRQVGVAQVGVAQVGAAQVCATQVGATQVGPDEVDPDQVLPGEVGPVQVFLVHFRQPAF